MSEPTTLAVGDIVRVKDHRCFIAAFGEKVRDRDAEVLWVGPDGIGQWKGYVEVRFLKRNGRGREFVERMQVREFVKQGEPA